MSPEDLTAAKIAIVDDEPAIVRFLERLLNGAGYHNLSSITDSRQALDVFRGFQPDLVLLDLLMPHLDGIAVLEQLRAIVPADAYLPVLVLTGDVTPDAKRRALEAGANDFLAKPFERFEMLLRVRNLLETRRLYRELEMRNRSLEHTVRERTERLYQSEKVATMGALLAGVAHELNNPLAALSGQTQLLRGVVTDPDLIRRTEKIEEAARRCVRIVRNFLALARQQPAQRIAVSLNQIVEGAVELLAYDLRTDDVELVLELAGNVPVLWADPDQLHQVIVNLLTNAHQAMRQTSRPRRITVASRHDPARGHIVLEVADSGPGISREIQTQIFEPFFTTKPRGEGTGLGLSLCRGVVEDHGGTIAADNAPGGGARFVIELPVVPRSAGRVGAEPIEIAARVGPRTILVVDDEPDVAAVLVEALARDGHEAHVAMNGAMALEMLARHPYDLVISDTKMPILDGERLYEELARRFPALRERVIFLTGDVLSVEKRGALERTGRPFLTKPCDLGEMRRLVQRVLTATANGRVARGGGR